MQHLKVITNKRLRKGQYFIRIIDSIDKIENFLQIDPTRKLIELFWKRTGDLELKEELLEYLFKKAKEYQHYDSIHHPKKYIWTK